MSINSKKPILGFAAYSGVGKTTLLINLIPILKSQGINVGVIKHAHHDFDIDKPGKDSYEIRKTGVEQMLIGSDNRLALMVEREASEPSIQLDECISFLNQEKLDLILVEGFKWEAFPKIELHRPSLHHPLICENDDNVIAVASDAELPKKINLPILAIDNHEKIANYIIEIIHT